MKKKNLLFIISSLVAVTSLSSCYFLRITINDSTSNSYSNPTGNAIYKTPNYTSSFSKDNLTIEKVGTSFDYHYLPSTGNSKLLVIPIQFTDDSFSTTELSRIQNSFFGDSTNTGWQSVASYYNTSSYGKLNITGEVAPTITLSSTVADAQSAATAYEKKNSGNYTDSILEAAVKKLDSNGFDFTGYDSNSDGYVDAVWMVYSASYDTNSDFYWAYTTWTSSSSKCDSLSFSTYSWASVDFLTEYNYYRTDKTKNGDAHTFIHETGHMMGLDDYYSYDYDGKTNYDTPTGGIDMMDFNIGDHDSYSKYILGWKTPTVVTPSYLTANNNQLSLSSFTENGDSLLIPIYDSDGNDDYNETAFDEYLLLELYTPTGLNEMDSNNLYTNNLREYTKPGILVYHVNSRIGKVSVSGSSLVWDGYSYDKLPSSWSSYVGYTYICSNTRSYCYDSSLSDTGLKFYRGRLISLLPSTGTKIEGKKTGYSSNECLFTKGDSFKDSYSSFVFDEGTSPRYDFSVDSVTTSKATLTFSDFN